MQTLEDGLLRKFKVQTYTKDGELNPDPNLILNLDHMISFLEIDMAAWKNHSEILNKTLSSLSEIESTVLLFEPKNQRIYLKSLFSISTCYVAIIEALKALRTQLQENNVHLGARVSTPKIKDKDEFNQKIRNIRNFSYIHQSSNNTNNAQNKKNIMDKRLAMTWAPTVKSMNDKKLTSESYSFGSGKWWIKVNGSKTESKVDFEVNGLEEFSRKAMENVIQIKNELLEFNLKIYQHQNET